MGLFKAFLYIGIAASVALFLFLFYVLSVNIDRALTDRALQKLQDTPTTELQFPR